MTWSNYGPAAPAVAGPPTIRPRLPTHGGHRPDKTAPTQMKETGQICPVSKFVRRGCAVERQQVFNNRNRSTMPSRVCWTDGINLSGLRKYRRDTCWQSRPRTWPPPVRTTRDNDRGPVQERKDGGKQPTAPRWSGTIEKDRVKQPYRIKDPGQVVDVLRLGHQPTVQRK